MQQSEQIAKPLLPPSKYARTADATFLNRGIELQFSIPLPIPPPALPKLSLRAGVGGDPGGGPKLELCRQNYRSILLNAQFNREQGVTTTTVFPVACIRHHVYNLSVPAPSIEAFEPNPALLGSCFDLRRGSRIVLLLYICFGVCGGFSALWP